MARGQVSKKTKSTKTKKTAKMGRPTRFKQEYIKQAGKLCLLGFTEEQLADFFGCTTKTLHNWKKAHPEFLLAIKGNKAIKDAEVAETLLNKALGNITIVEQKVSAMGDVLDCKKQLAPDTASIIFWLKNRQPELWRDKQADSDASETLADAFTKMANSLPT